MPPMDIIEMPAADIMGRVVGGQVAVMMTSAPLVRPEAPMPETVLPPMIWLLDRERAETKFPSSKMRKNAMKVY